MFHLFPCNTSASIAKLLICARRILLTAVACPCEHAYVKCKLVSVDQKAWQSHNLFVISVERPKNLGQRLAKYTAVCYIICM